MFKLLTLLSLSLFIGTEANVSVNCDITYEFDYFNEFSSFINTYNKSYSSSTYLLYRYLIFADNMEYINQRNSMNLSYTLAMNRFGDLSVFLLKIFLDIQSAPCRIPIRVPPELTHSFILLRYLG